MKSFSTSNEQMSFLGSNLLEQLNPEHPLTRLEKQVPWTLFEKEFSRLYKAGGRPAKPIRLMTGLLILKQMGNLTDDKVIREWVQNPYFQAFCGVHLFSWKPPCNASELSSFRKRIGEEGIRKVFQSSLAMYRKLTLIKLNNMVGATV